MFSNSKNLELKFIAWIIRGIELGVSLQVPEKEIADRAQNISVCNFQFMKTPVELNSLLSKFFCYITWLDATMDDL